MQKKPYIFIILLTFTRCPETDSPSENLVNLYHILSRFRGISLRFRVKSLNYLGHIKKKIVSIKLPIVVEKNLLVFEENTIILGDVDFPASRFYYKFTDTTCIFLY